MKRKLKEELLRLSRDIINSEGLEELPELYQRTRELYEKLAVLTFIEERLGDIEVDVSKSEVASKFEAIASAVLDENKKVPESNPHEEDIIIPGIDTIKHMVSEMPGGDELEDVLEQLIGNNEFVKSDRDTVTPREEDLASARKNLPKPPPARSLNDTLTNKEISVGLNDRLAFTKHLFNDNSEAFNTILSKLNSMDSQEGSLSFIRQEVKPKYDDWKGKDEYEARFMALIERRFN